ncbi:flagellar motor protein MotB [Yunchengibacter salinarum]|uniref:flagellar motor protein MotB n=1 Tax=Yunchengibacter salinarum TaxID=3133399 RepID=UPI0035B5E9DF
MADNNGDDKPIIKKVKKVDGGGAHGGAWKVAYADFTTAMMAFFMLLWLLNVAPPETLEGLADYFSPTSAATSGRTGAKAINTPKDDALGSNPSPVVAISKPGPPPEGSTEGSKSGAEVDSATDPAKDVSGPGKGANEAAQDRMEEISARIRQQEDRAFDALKADLRIAMQESTVLKDHADQLIFEVTDDGMKIQLVDKDNRAMFERGGAELYDYARQMIARVSSEVQDIPNRISVEGHTDAGTFVGPEDYTKWELSADRANAARRVLADSGVSRDRFSQVVGKADTDPLYPDRPSRTENRRITIMVLREAPVVPPGNNR